MSQIDAINTGAASALAQATAAPNAAPNAAAAGGRDFSNVFNETIMRQMTESMMAGNSSASGGMSLMPDDSFGMLQSMLLSNAANGETNGNELLMMMMMFMMREFKGSDMSPLMAAMNALMPGANSTGYNPYNPGFLPKEAWLPTTFQHSSSPGNRSADALSRVIAQFHVETAERYRPYRNGSTYCNIFVWDVTRALGCEIPHYIDRATGEPRYYPDVRGAYELDANGVADWLVRQGAQNGWREISATEAQMFANAGFPVVSAWHSKGSGAGHVQMVRPSRDGSFDPVRGVTVAQAGMRNFNYAHITQTMSKDKIAQTRYYVHD